MRTTGQLSQLHYNSWVRVRPNSSAGGSAMVRPGFGSAKGVRVRFGVRHGSAKNSLGSVRFGQNWVRSYP